MTLNKGHNISDFFKKEVKVLYYLIALFFVLGYIGDIIAYFYEHPRHILLTDAFVLIVIILSFLLYLKKIISLQLSYLTIVYTSIIALFLAYIHSLKIGAFTTEAIFQDLITIAPLIFATGFIVNKRHMLIVGMLFLISYPTIMLISNEKVLNNSASFIALMIIGTTIAAFIFISFIEEALKRNAEANEKISKQKEDLERLNEERTKLFSIIAHDLRNPMGNAVNVATLLLENDIPLEDRKALTGTIYGMTKKAYHLLENILNWSKTEQGAFNIQIVKVDLRTAAQKAVDNFTIELADKNLKIENNIDESLAVLSDEMVLDTAFRNLISNAIKFSEVGGTIFLDAHTNKDATVTFSVRDTGVGMPAEKAKILFDSNAATKPGYGTRNEKGVGLGLKLTKSLIEKAHGTIDLISKEGKGTTFLVTFPKAK